VKALGAIVHEAVDPRKAIQILDSESLET